MRSTHLSASKVQIQEGQWHETALCKNMDTNRATANNTRRGAEQELTTPFPRAVVHVPSRIGRRGAEVGVAQEEELAATLQGAKEHGYRLRRKESSIPSRTPGSGPCRRPRRPGCRRWCRQRWSATPSRSSPSFLCLGEPHLRAPSAVLGGRSLVAVGARGNAEAARRRPRRARRGHGRGAPPPRAACRRGPCRSQAGWLQDSK